MRFPLLPAATNMLSPSPTLVAFAVSRVAEVTQTYKRQYQSHGVTRDEFFTPLFTSGLFLRETDVRSKLRLFHDM
jgi:hypothetical protein